METYHAGGQNQIVAAQHLLLCHNTHAFLIIIFYPFMSEKSRQSNLFLSNRKNDLKNTASCKTQQWYCYLKRILRKAHCKREILFVFYRLLDYSIFNSLGQIKCQIKPLCSFSKAAQHGFCQFAMGVRRFLEVFLRILVEFS